MQGHAHLGHLHAAGLATTKPLTHFLTEWLALDEDEGRAVSGHPTPARVVRGRQIGVSGIIGVDEGSSV